MRIATLGLLAVLASASSAAAADLDYGYLRGAEDDYAPAPVIDWSGFYVGGHGGYSSAAMGYHNVFQPALANYFWKTLVEQEYQVSNLLVLPSRRRGGSTFGAIAGYNVQFDDIVIGIEVDYTTANISTASDSIFFARTFELSNGKTEVVALKGSSATKLQDYGTIRGRAGYALGSFLPFVTAGAAIGRANIIEGALLSYSGSIAPQPEAVGVKVKSKAMAGVALGAGLEFALTSNILLRGEYQYVMFDDFDKHKINVNTVRGGAAVKF